MARLNTATRTTRRTHEGTRAKRIGPEAQLRRSLLACMLWEKQFYEDGQEIAERIAEGVREVSPATVAALADEARNEHNLRHAPLLLISALIRSGNADGTGMVQHLIPKVVRRADELTELVAIHCALNGVGPDKAKKVLSAQMKLGLAEAFRQFDAYQLAKYDRAGPIRLRDVLFMVHAKPKDKEQEQIWSQLIDGTLPAPDTWEVGLSRGGDKRKEFERLLLENKLGYMALLRNLRNMIEATVDPTLVRTAIRARRGAQRVLPFRYVAAARHARQFEPDLDAALQASIAEAQTLPGRTLVLVDVSISMNAPLSNRSDLTRMDAAAALAAVVPAEELRVFSFSSKTVEVPPRRGMAGVDAVIRSQPHATTNLGDAVRQLNGIPHDRLIVITDEQSRTPVPDPVADRAYMINVASYQHGVGYGKWTHIDGFSESVIRYIQALEEEAAKG